MLGTERGQRAAVLPVAAVWESYYRQRSQADVTGVDKGLRNQRNLSTPFLVLETLAPSVSIKIHFNRVYVISHHNSRSVIRESERIGFSDGSVSSWESIVIRINACKDAPMTPQILPRTC